MKKKKQSMEDSIVLFIAGVITTVVCMFFFYFMFMYTKKCPDYTNQSRAQLDLVLNPKLDHNKDGIACNDKK